MPGGNSHLPRITVQGSNVGRIPGVREFASLPESLVGTKSSKTPVGNL